jgi:hypothetical protein
MGQKSYTLKGEWKMRFAYKKLDNLFNKQIEYVIKGRAIDREIDALIINFFGEEMGEMILADTDFTDATIAYASNGEGVGVEKIKTHINKAYERAKMSMSGKE